MAQLAANALPHSATDIPGDPTTDGLGCVGPVGSGTLFVPQFAQGTNVLTVGSGKQFATIAQAVGAAHDHDVILVDAGTYTNDFATVRADITLIGVGGMVNMIATIPPANLKGILTVDNNVTIENFSFSGSAIGDADGGNGAGIRYEGGNMVLRNDTFDHNQNGILGFPVIGAPSNTIVLDHDTFNANGSGTGYTHNVYIGAVDKLTVTNSVFEQANVGHELKSRALVSDIENNIFYDGPYAPSSYDIDLPNGGRDIVRNNTIEKGASAENNGMVHFSGEGIPYAGSSLLVTGNVFIDDKGSAVGLLNQSAITATVTGNAFVNMDGSRLANGPTKLTNNVDGHGTPFTDGNLVGVLPGSTQIYTDSNPHSIVMQGGSILAVQGGGGLLDVTAVAGHIVAIGGSGGMRLTEAVGSGGNSITTAANSTNVIVVSGQDLIDSEGNDTLTVGGGNITAQINGVATVYASASSSQWAVNGRATMHAGGGTDIVSVGPSGFACITGAETYLSLGNNGGSATIDLSVSGVAMNASIVGGSALLRTFGNAMNVTTGGGAQGADMTFAKGDAVVMSVGPDVMHAGSGNDIFIVSGAATIYGGTGQLSVFGRGDNAGSSIYGNGGTVTLDGDTGHLTYYGGAKSSTVLSKLSNDRFVGGTGRLTIQGGSRETIQGGAGGLTFNSLGGGANTIVTAAQSKNVLVLSGSDSIDSSGTDSITTTGSLTGAVRGNSTINAGADDVALTVSGTSRFVGLGHDTLWVAAGAVANVTMSGFATVYETAATLNYRGGNDGSTVLVTGNGATVHSDYGSGVVVTTNQGAASNVTLGSGTATVISAARDQIHLGSANAVVQTQTAGVEIWAGSGTATINDHDWTTGDTISIHGGSGALSYQGCGAMSFIGGSGDAVLDGQGGSLQVVGGTGALTLLGGMQGVSFVGGAGRATINLTPGGGQITFGSGATTVNEASWGAPDIYTAVRGHAPATDVITGFRIGVDRIALSGLTLNAAAIVKGSANLTLSDKSHIVLAGVTDTTHLF